VTYKSAVSNNNEIFMDIFMRIYLTNKRNSFLSRRVSVIITFTFLVATVISSSYAQSLSTLNIPIPGSMVTSSVEFVPVLLKGMTIYPEEPLRLDFIVDSGNTDFTPDEVQKESERLLKYFMVAMTTPKNDLWVNLSPYESKRIIPDELGKTELGRDMLIQDYFLKQLTSSLMHPEDDLGKEFWSQVYTKMQEKFGVSDIPMNTFNKVWIMPESAMVYEHENTVYVIESRLKVLMDEDYLALDKNKSNNFSADNDNESSGLSSNIIREIILPEIEREVNEGENFKLLRQVYHSLILSQWYKETIKESLLSKVYVDQRKTVGLQLDDITLKDQIYERYLEAYKKGVFHYIKEDYDQLSLEVIPRKYFSGGGEFVEIPIQRRKEETRLPLSVVGDSYQLQIGFNPQKESGEGSLLRRSKEVNSDLLGSENAHETQEVLEDNGVLSDAIENGEIKTALVLPWRRFSSLGDSLLRRPLISSLVKYGIETTSICHNVDIIGNLPNIRAVDYRNVSRFIQDDVFNLTEFSEVYPGKYDLIINQDPSLEISGADDLPFVVRISYSEKNSGNTVTLKNNGKNYSDFILNDSVNLKELLLDLYRFVGFENGLGSDFVLSEDNIDSARRYLDSLRIVYGSKTKFVLINPGVGKEVLKGDQEYRLDKVVMSVDDWVSFINQLIESDPDIIILLGGSAGPGNTFVPDHIKEIFKYLPNSERVIDSHARIESDWLFLGALLKDPRVILQIGYESGTVQHLSDILRVPSLALFAEHINSFRWGGYSHMSWYAQIKKSEPFSVEGLLSRIFTLEQLKRGDIGAVFSGEVMTIEIEVKYLLDQVSNLESSGIIYQNNAVIEKIQEIELRLLSLLRNRDLANELLGEKNWERIDGQYSELSAKAYKQTNFYKLIAWVHEILTTDVSMDIEPRIKFESPIGGIDMNEIKVNRQGSSFDMKFDPVIIQNIVDQGVDGFIPVIINLTPINNLMNYLGLYKNKSEELYDRTSRIEPYMSDDPRDRIQEYDVLYVK
jgi:hypothetical protein